MAAKHLFEVPISTGGSFVCTSPEDRVYILTFNSPPDNRITPAFLTSLLLALDVLERKYPHGVLITTSAIPKFYSNGFNLSDLVENPKFIPQFLIPALRRLLT
jgi:enoyl-CoA hydratase/carnithine racemase